MASTTAAAATFPSSTSAAASWNPKSKADEGLEKDARRDVVDVEMDHDDNDDAQDDGPNDEDDAIDPEQLDEYKDMVERLGSFPDKVAINSLSMVAEDHADSRGSARAIYSVIRQRLLSTGADNLLPLVYVIDSILKNVKGQYVDVIGSDAQTWLPTVYRKLPDPQRKQKLHKVYNTWVDLKLFSPDRLKAIGVCFEASPATSAAASQSSALAGGLKQVVAGITRASDGRLLIAAPLRRAMEDILNQLQSDMENELDKVSLERLAELNPELLGNIKQTAEENSKAASTAAASDGGTDGAAKVSEAMLLPPYFVETRSPEAIEQSRAWTKVKLGPSPDSDPEAVIKSLRGLVDREKQTGYDGAKLYTQQEAGEMTRILAGALAAASVLQSVVDRIKEEEQHQKQQPSQSGSTSGGAFSSSFFLSGHGGGVTSGRYSVDRLKFTNRGVKERDDNLIGMLYEIGLPFLSSVDGRRFATQGELSGHLDALFRRNQLEKSIARTEERGWYVSDDVWTLEKADEDLLLASSAMGGPSSSEAAASGGDAGKSDGYDPQTSSVAADETRDRCVVCGINFKMVFDDGDGIYKYTNCREIVMMNDDAADVESEQVLVHVTCWRGLGSPHVLTSDQALQETLHR